MNKVKATEMMDKMRSDTESNTGRTVSKYTIATSDDFLYTDPVDGSVAKKQGIRFLMADGSRIIFRLSGTAGSGATVVCISSSTSQVKLIVLYLMRLRTLLLLHLNYAT